MDPEQNNISGNNGLPTATNGASKGPGTITAVVAIVIVVLAVLGWYVIGQNALTPNVMEQTGTETTSATVVDAPTESLGAQATTDDMTSIEADLKATDLDSLGDVNQI